MAVLAAGALAAGLTASAQSDPDLPRAPSVGVSRWRGPTLCQPGERISWSCRAGRRIISVCASPRVTADSGYIQYRIGRPGRLEMQYPVTRTPPRGRFRYSMTISGNESLSFEVGRYGYAIFEDLRSPEDGVSVTRGDREVSRITCDGGGNGFSILRPDLLGIADSPYGT